MQEHAGKRGGWIATVCSLALALPLAGGGLMLAPSTAEAQRAGADRDEERETRQVQAMRERVFQGLAAAQEKVDEDDYAGAQRELDRLRRIDDLNTNEQAQILRFAGYIYVQLEQMSEAITAFERVVNTPDVPSGLKTDTLWTLVQLTLAEEQYEKTIEYGNRWLEVVENPGGDPFYRIAVAEYQLERYTDAVTTLNRAIEIGERTSDGAPEAWFGLLLAAYFSLEDTDNQREVLEILVTRWPSKQYWIHLSAIYGEQGHEKKQVAVLEALYESGQLDRENEIVQLAQLYLQAGGPYKAARMLEKGMDDGIVEENHRNYRLLSQAWMRAQDDRRAVGSLSEAARRGDDGNLFVQLAQSYYNLDEPENCVEAARDGIDRGGLNREDTAHMVLGLCQMELERWDQAREALRVASRDERSRRAANQWIDFIDREVERRRDIEQQLAQL